MKSRQSALSLLQDEFFPMLPKYWLANGKKFSDFSEIIDFVNNKLINLA